MNRESRDADDWFLSHLLFGFGVHLYSIHDSLLSILYYSWPRCA